MTLVPNETEQALNRQYDVYAAAREEYRKKISEQAARIEQLENALREIAEGKVSDHPIELRAFCRAALEEKNGNR